ANNPLQLSLMYVHEWLWRHTPNAQVVRDANLFFHSTALTSMSVETIQLSLKNMGLGYFVTTREVAKAQADLLALLDRGIANHAAFISKQLGERDYAIEIDRIYKELERLN